MSIAENVEAFRIALLVRVPFYGEVVSNIPFLKDGDIPTACTDGLSVRYNERFFAKLTQPQQNFVLLHEVFHILLGHCKRPHEKYPMLWNAALDLVVNGMLFRLISEMRRTGIELECPPDAICKRSGYVKSADEYYAELLELNRDSRDKKTVAYKGPNPTYGGVDAIQRAPAPNDLPEPGEVAEISAELRQMVRQALQSAEKSRTPGLSSVSVPQEFQSIALVKPLNWKRIFKDMLQECEDEDDASWATPERKYLHMDMLVPGHCRGENDALGESWMFIDSSGSISGEEMNRFLSEAWHILHDFHTTMNIAYWDTRVTDVYRGIDSEKQLKDCLPRHSGGTDINCVYDYIRAQRLRPDVLLILTDGEFGALKDEGALRSLKERTMLVLSSGQTDLAPFKKYGKIASL